MNNYVYGKAIENVRNHRDIKLVKSGKEENDQFQNPIITSIKIFRIFNGNRNEKDKNTNG